MKVIERSSDKLVIYQSLSEADIKPMEFINIILFVVLLLDGYEAINLSDYYITFLHLPATLLLWIYLMRNRFKEIFCTIDKASGSIVIRERGMYLLEREFKSYSMQGVSQIKQVKLLVKNSYLNKYKIQFFISDKKQIQLNCYDNTSIKDIRKIASAICQFLDISSYNEIRLSR